MRRIRRFLGLLSLLFVVLCARGAYADSCTIGTSIENGECQNGTIYCNPGYYVLAGRCWDCGILQGITPFTIETTINGELSKTMRFGYSRANGTGGTGDDDAQCGKKFFYDDLEDPVYTITCSSGYSVYIDGKPYLVNGEYASQAMVDTYPANWLCAPTCAKNETLENGICTVCSGFITKDEVCTTCPAHGVCSGRTLTCELGYVAW